MMRKFKLAIYFFLACIFCEVHAQKQLSLSEALITGLEKNFQIQIAGIENQKAANNNSWGAAGRYPSINFRLTQNNAINEQNSPISFVQGQYGTQGLSPSIDAGFTLFNGFKVKITKNKLDRLEKFTQGNSGIIIENTVQAIVLAYNKCLLEQEKLLILQKTIVASRNRFHLATEQSTLGLSTSFDITLQKDAYLQDSSNLVLQQLNIENNQKNLNLLLGLPPDTSFTLTDKLHNDLADYTYESLVETMLKDNMSYKTQFTNLFIKSSDIDLSKAALYPTVMLNLGSNFSASRFTRDGESLDGTTLSYYANFTLSFNLFNGHQVKRQIENANLEFEKESIKMDEMELQLKNQLSIVASNYNTQKLVYSLAKSRSTNAAKNYRLAQEKYNAGIITIFDLRDIELNHLRTIFLEKESLYRIIEAETELARLTGGITQN